MKSDCPLPPKSARPVPQFTSDKIVGSTVGVYRLHRDNERFAEWLIAIIQPQLRSHLCRAQHQTKLSCTVVNVC